MYISVIVHESVLLEEAIKSLHINKDGKYIDATVGAGGHSVEICKRGGKVLGIDTDLEMLEVARRNLEKACPGSFKLVHGNFRNLATIAKENGFKEADGVLMDLGVSNIHLKGHTRGFSFSDPELELDMRLDPSSQGVKASDLLNNLREDQLVQLFERVMIPPGARKLAKKIIDLRNTKRIETVGDFLQIFPEKRIGKTHPATKAFLALRMAVNTELENLEEGLKQAMEIVKPGGHLAVITFHSLEDKIVKDFFGKESELILPSLEEIEKNKKARSAKLRVYEKK